MHADGGATPAPDSGVTLAEAAGALGISKDAARRRLRAGRLAGHQAFGPHGPAWCVHLDSPIEARHGGDTPAPGSCQPGAHGGATAVQPVDVAALIGLVDRLQRENKDLAATAAVWQERARVLGEQLALQAPQDAPETQQDADPGVAGRQSSTGPSAPGEPISAPWWSRWLVALAGS
jgi:hypothetical protein